MQRQSKRVFWSCGHSLRQSCVLILSWSAPSIWWSAPSIHGPPQVWSGPPPQLAGESPTQLGLPKCRRHAAEGYQPPRVDDATARGGDGSGATACASPASRRGMFRVRSCPLNVQAGFRFSLELRENIISHNGWSGTPECRAQYALQVDAMARENVHMLKS